MKDIGDFDNPERPTESRRDSIPMGHRTSMKSTEKHKACSLVPGGDGRHQRKGSVFDTQSEAY